MKRFFQHFSENSRAIVIFCLAWVAIQYAFPLTNTATHLLLSWLTVKVFELVFRYGAKQTMVGWLKTAFILAIFCLAWESMKAIWPVMSSALRLVLCWMVAASVSSWVSGSNLLIGK